MECFFIILEMYVVQNIVGNEKTTFLYLMAPSSKLLEPFTAHRKYLSLWFLSHPFPTILAVHGTTSGTHRVSR